MTEKRSPYHAFSGEYLGNSPSPLVCHHTDGSVSRDTIFFLPLLASAGSTEDASPCLQQVHLPNGDPAFCCKKTEITCACCGSAACLEHRTRGFLSTQDDTGAWQCVYDAPLCETCAYLTSRMRTAIYAFRRVLNAEEG
jgi:hypothetical protein